MHAVLVHVFAEMLQSLERYGDSVEFFVISCKMLKLISHTAHSIESLPEPSMSCLRQMAVRPAESGRKHVAWLKSMCLEVSLDVYRMCTHICRKLFLTFFYTCRAAAILQDTPLACPAYSVQNKKAACWLLDLGARGLERPIPAL